MDKLVYLLLQLAPQAFFSLIGRAVEDAKNYTFQSIEVKETSFRIDGVLLPLIQNDVIYFIEAQFQLDEQLYARFFAEIFVYLKQYGVTNWKAAVIYPSRSVEQKNLDGYRELLESGRVQIIYLDELPDAGNEIGLFKLLIASEKTAPAVARKLIETATPIEINLIEQIIVYNFVKLGREEVKEVLGLQKELLKETQVYKEIFEEGELKGRQEGELKGKQEGELKGKREGELKGKLAAVPLLRKLGMSDKAIAENLELPLELVKTAPKP